MVKRYIAHHQKDIEKVHENPSEGRHEMFIVSRLDSKKQKFIRN